MSQFLPPNPNEGIVYDPKELKTIYLAGGCFWGTEAFVARIKGVAHTQCGYANGKVPTPTYEQVCREHTGHAETVRVDYHPGTVALGRLLDGFFQSINPTTKNRQGNDMGSQYRSGIYYVEEADLPEIQAAISRVQERFSAPVVTEALPLTCYYPAEEYHQRYLEKNPGGYCHVDFGKLPETGGAAQ